MKQKDLVLLFKTAKVPLEKHVSLIQLPYHGKKQLRSIQTVCETERIDGPALLVAKDTTIVLPTDYSAKMASGVIS